MTAGQRMIAGLKEALSFVRDECSHEWKVTKTEAKSGFTLTVAECPKCGVRKSGYTKRVTPLTQPCREPAQEDEHTSSAHPQAIESP